MKKLILFLFITILITSVLYGCEGKSAARPTQPATSKQPAAQGRATGSKEKSLSGVYMGFVNQWAITGLHSPQMQFAVFFEDGTFFSDMPPEGLEGFNKKKSQEYYKNEDKDFCWGTYTWNGTSGSWKWAGQEPDEMKLDQYGNLLIRNEPYYRLSPVDGLRLDGAWTVYANPEDVDAPSWWNKPIINFTPDGKFQDEGIFMEGDFFLPEQFEIFELDEKKVAPGKGTYEINNFTLTLKYDDGRVRKASFNLHFGTDMQPSPDPIFIYRRDLQLISSETAQSGIKPVSKTGENDNPNDGLKRMADTPSISNLLASLNTASMPAEYPRDIFPPIDRGALFDVFETEYDGEPAYILTVYTDKSFVEVVGFYESRLGKIEDKFKLVDTNYFDLSGIAKGFYFSITGNKTEESNVELTCYTIYVSSAE